jgi:hypothetical protein
MKLPSLFIVSVIAATCVMTVCRISAEEPAPSPASSVSDSAGKTTTEDKTTQDATKQETTDDDAAKEAKFPSPDQKFAFVLDSGEAEHSIDLIDKKTEEVLQHIDDSEISSVSYRVLWAPDSKRFALMTRAGHPNQDVRVYFLKGHKFKEIKIPGLEVEIPAKIRAGKEHPHVAANNWEEADKWNKDGSLLIRIDNTIDGAGHTASATRTVLLGFDKSDKPRILKSTVKYESKNDDDQ